MKVLVAVVAATLLAVTALLFVQPTSAQETYKLIAKQLREVMPPEAKCEYKSDGSPVCTYATSNLTLSMGSPGINPNGAIQFAELLKQSRTDDDTPLHPLILAFFSKAGIDGKQVGDCILNAERNATFVSGSFKIVCVRDGWSGDRLLSVTMFANRSF